MQKQMIHLPFSRVYILGDIGNRLPLFCILDAGGIHLLVDKLWYLTVMKYSWIYASDKSTNSFNWKLIIFINLQAYMILTPNKLEHAHFSDESDFFSWRGLGKNKNYNKAIN